MPKNIPIALIILFFLTACAVGKDAPIEKKAQDPAKNLMTGEIVEKANALGGKPDLYFRASIQDYYIKFCESAVSYEDVKPYVGKVITVRADVSEGNWDSCPGEAAEMQSRIGPYLIIRAIK